MYVHISICCCDFNFLIPYQRKKKLQISFNVKRAVRKNVCALMWEKQKMISSKRTCLQFLILIESP